VFCTSSGKALSLRNLNRDFNRRKAAFGIPPETRLQDLRGTFTSLLIDQGTGLRNVMELVGHADPKTTLLAYARGYSTSKA
ncbi:tyrosine-type recombinase/integrase, partial [Acinetobacter baumannii]